MVSGKAKGSGFEREMAKKLSLWISSGVRSDICWRSNNSGGQQTSYAKRGNTKYTNQAGDLASIDPLADEFFSKVSVELKFYKDLQVENLLFQKPCKIMEFWETHKRLCKKVGKTPVLIAKQNQRPIIVLLPDGVDFPKLKGAFLHGFVLYTLVELLQNVTYEEFMETI